MDKSAMSVALEETLKQDQAIGWYQEDAIALCVLIEDICPRYGCHVALTGGSLYKPGKRKDADILFYRIRQVAKIDEEGLLRVLKDGFGFVIGDRYGWVVKATYQDKQIDLFFPETDNETFANGNAVYARK